MGSEAEVSHQRQRLKHSLAFSGSPSTAPQYVQDPPRQDTKEKMDLEPTAGRQQSSDAVCMIEKGSDMKRASNIFARMEMQLTRGPLRRVSSNSCFRLILCQSSGLRVSKVQRSKGTKKRRLAECARWTFLFPSVTCIKSSSCSRPPFLKLPCRKTIRISCFLSTSSSRSKHTRHPRNHRLYTI